MIRRNIEKELVESAEEYPVVTIFGPRQSGKTTLAKMIFPKHLYISLEDPDIRMLAKEDPRSLLNRGEDGMILDEVQRVPELLSYIQTIVDNNSRKGQFILTGSHQPDIRHAVSQSLAGRTAILELLPFSINELKSYKKPLPSVYRLILDGFYPRLHNNNLKTSRFYRSYIQTYIERDVRSIIDLKQSGLFEKMLYLLAGRVGQVVNYSSLASDVGVSSMTIKSWIDILKQSFILFELRPYFKNIGKQLIKSSKLYFTDTGLVSFLLKLRSEDMVERDPLRGQLYENLIIMDIVKNGLNFGLEPDLFFFRDSHGHEVDLLISEGSSFIPVEIKSAETFSDNFLKGINYFRKVSGASCLPGYVLYNGMDNFIYKDVKVENYLLHSGINIFE